MRKSRTEYVILGALTLRPMSGYDIAHFVRDTVSHFWSESFGQIYPALRHLEETGRVSARRKAGARGRERTVYTLLRPGREALREWLARPAAPPVPRYEHSLKLFFGRHAQPEAMTRLIAQVREDHARRLNHYRAMERDLRARLDTDPDARFQLAVLRGGVRYAGMVLEWTREVEEILDPVLEASREGDAA